LQTLTSYFDNTETSPTFVCISPKRIPRKDQNYRKTSLLLHLQLFCRILFLTLSLCNVHITESTVCIFKLIYVTSTLELNFMYNIS
jgi:hypothetical protein